ncbi:hypothetical protein HYC85_018395 [Camellia sinensis]|uniref:Uncharacterized protein n=1 Tax=Camellia sinensis TaxID=4442 RepID=A0A7J7GY29_CAMSI|nr:hypothetical protein HYC85_018395 [Camellia sinensis]
MQVFEFSFASRFFWLVLRDLLTHSCSAGEFGLLLFGEFGLLLFGLSLLGLVDGLSQWWYGCRMSKLENKIWMVKIGIIGNSLVYMEAALIGSQPNLECVLSQEWWLLHPLLAAAMRNGVIKE